MDSRFEEYLLQLLRRRVGNDWKLQVCDAVLGLCAEAARFAEVAGSWPDRGVPNLGQQVQALIAFEQFRALCYYQLDQRPPRQDWIPEPDENLDDVLRGLLMSAGHLADAISGWLFRGEPVEAESRLALARLEHHRTALYGHLQVKPFEVWQASRLNGPRRPSRSGSASEIRRQEHQAPIAASEAQ